MRICSLHNCLLALLLDATYVNGFVLPFNGALLRASISNAISLKFPQWRLADRSRGDSDSDSELDRWISQQRNASFHAILSNIGGGTDSLLGKPVLPGVVIASPSTSSPNYFFQWTRDSALTMSSLIQSLADCEFKGDAHIKFIVEKYIENCYHVQRIPNRSGTFHDCERSGLGEPKFLTDNHPFNEDWGRPQRDGPGLRAITVLSYLTLLDRYNQSLSNRFIQSPQHVFESIVKPDIDYILRNWHRLGFDLWEEIDAHHFFTSITQLKAVKDAIGYANNRGDARAPIAQWVELFHDIKEYIEATGGFINLAVPYIVETPLLFQHKRRLGLDIAVLLGSLHAHSLFDDPADELHVPYDVTSLYVLNTLQGLVGDMKKRYPINHDATAQPHRAAPALVAGVALGRYPEDVYDGHGFSEGNPWFLATATAAEVIYRYINSLCTVERDVVVNSESRGFLTQFIEDPKLDAEYSIPHGLRAHHMLVRNLFSYSDSFLLVVLRHVGSHHEMSEQFNKYTGFMQGAQQLTWSHSSVWNAMWWRDQVQQCVDNTAQRLI